jgi:hypothetical protein
LVGRGTIDWASAGWAVQKVRGVELNFGQRNFNFLGNAVGSAEVAALRAYNIGSVMGQQSVAVAPANRSYDSITYGYTYGYSGATDDGSATEDSSLPFSTVFLHGDYEYTSNAVTWNSGNSNHTLPNSFYRSSKPAWFGASQWPSIGPDVTDGIGARGHARAIPAYSCYTSGAKRTDGTLIFNSNNCYPPEDIVPPAAPSGFIVN